jgi:osmoprotectant transport system permease protein
VRERPAAPAAAAAGVDLRTIVFAAIGLVSALALPFVRVRPNRVADGVLQLMLQLDPAAAAGLALIWLAAAGCAVAPLSARIRGRVTAAASLLAPLCTVLYAGLVCRRLGGPDPIARVSLSTGFWITMLAGYAAFISASGRSAAGDLQGPRGAAARAPLIRRLPAVGVPVVLAALLLSGLLDPVSVMREFAVQKKVFLAETGTHAALAGAAVLIGGVLGVGIGVRALRHAVFRRVAFFIVNIVQTIPSLALFGLLILPLAALSARFPLLHSWGISGIGRAPALIALSFYAMLPIARNTYTGLEQIPASLRDAGAGMGMTRGQLLARVEVPLALPLILAGVRTAAVQAVGNTVVTALIGAGGLGVFIFQGLGQFASDMILLGTLPVIAMAVLTDMLMGGLVRAVTPKPLREPA